MQNAMRKIRKNILQIIVDWLKEIIDDELEVIDAFYQQYA